MTRDKQKFEHLASLCDCLAISSSSPEQRETFVDLAQKWRAMAITQELYEVPEVAAHHSAVKAWLAGLGKTSRYPAITPLRDDAAAPEKEKGPVETSPFPELSCVSRD